ncbi:MAG: class I SAM-dependent methyltransferase [Chlorobiaceae bacterium]|jgi:SAM-dependent methyltransferase
MAKNLHSSGNESSPIWYETWFNHPLYLELYSHRDNDEAARCIHTILSLSGLDLKKPASLSVLDIACGAGRHALELARLGYIVTGNDLSPYLLEEARKAALKSHLPLKLSCYDMRLMATNDLYDLVVQLFTSFGYFDLKEDDQLVIKNAHGLLKSDGWYVLDLLNPLYLAKNLVPYSRRNSGKLSIIEERAFSGNRITKSMSITPLFGETVTFNESVRLYSEEEIRAMLQNEGFTVASIVGNYQGEPFTPNDSPRMMIFSRKG